MFTFSNGFDMEDEDSLPDELDYDDLDNVNLKQSSVFCANRV